MQERESPDNETTERAIGTYRFGRSRQVFREPRPALDAPYIAFIGGSETFGRFSPVAYPELLQRALGVTCANWGTPGAGPGFFLKDPVILEACSNAKACVVPIMGAHTVSNRLYSVYPRRNERLRSTSEMLRTLYPRVDFSRFRYVANMLIHLNRADPERFALVRLELRDAWIARMTELMTDIETRKILVWFSDRTPEETEQLSLMEERRALPAFVTRRMIEAVIPFADIYAEYAADNATAEDLPSGRTRRSRAARRHPSAAMHRDLADALEGPLRKMTSRNPLSIFGLGDG